MKTKKKHPKTHHETWVKNALKGRIMARVKPSVIRVLRDQSLQDQAAIAFKIGLAESTYGAIETGRRTVDKKVAEKLAGIFKKPVKVLFEPAEKGRYKAVFTTPNPIGL